MDLRRLSIFLEVTNEGSFTAAADVLGCSQPAVSQAIRELESELETPLFHRIGRRIQLTPAGAVLVAPVRRLLRDVEVSRATVRAVANLQDGQLDLVCLPTLAAAPLAPLVGAFRQRHSGVLVTIGAPEDTEELIEQVRRGHAELGIVDDVAAPDLRAVSLGRQDFLAVFPPGTPCNTRIALRELVAFPLVASQKGTSSRRLLDDAFAAADETPRVGVETSQREALLPLILAGAGVGLLPRPLASYAATLGCSIAELTPRVQRSIVLVHRKGPLTPGARAFINLIDETLFNVAI
ncbi:MAG: LysR family transcriptional regulator [Acidimicrobiales bacterium]